MKTGECYFLDEQGNLWIAESFQDEFGVVTTTHTLIQKAEEINHSNELTSSIL